MKLPMANLPGNIGLNLCVVVAARHFIHLTTGAEPLCAIPCFFSQDFHEPSHRFEPPN